MELKDRFLLLFFRENCAFNLLKAIEAGRPGSRLVDRLSAWVIPLETIRAVQEAGLFSGERVFRPSKASRIRAMEDAIAADHKETARLIAMNRRDPDAVLSDTATDREAKIRTLDLAAEYIQYRFLRKETGKKAYLESYIKVLGLRSSLGKGVEYEVSQPLPPEGPRAYAPLSGGRQRLYRSGTANHGLMDPTKGIFRQDPFFDTELRYDH